MSTEKRRTSLLLVAPAIALNSRACLVEPGTPTCKARSPRSAHSMTFVVGEVRSAVATSSSIPQHEHVRTSIVGLSCNEPRERDGRLDVAGPACSEAHRSHARSRDVRRRRVAEHAGKTRDSVVRSDCTIRLSMTAPLQVRCSEPGIHRAPPEPLCPGHRAAIHGRA